MLLKHGYGWLSIKFSAIIVPVCVRVCARARVCKIWIRLFEHEVCRHNCFGGEGGGVSLQLIVCLENLKIK